MDVAPRRLVDKSVRYSMDAECLDRIRAACPDACYVHVVEHPLTPGAATAPGRPKGLLGAGLARPGNQDPSADQLQWLSSQQLIAECMRHVATEKLTVLRLEDLLADPRTQLADLCVRLDLPNDEAAVADMLHPEKSPFARFGPVGANLGDVAEFLRDPTFPPKGIFGGTAEIRHGPERMLPEVAQSAAQYGYSAMDGA
jgi:hypothetical protein